MPRIESRISRFSENEMMFTLLVIRVTDSNGFTVTNEPDLRSGENWLDSLSDDSAFLSLQKASPQTRENQERRVSVRSSHEEIVCPIHASLYSEFGG